MGELRRGMRFGKLGLVEPYFGVAQYLFYDLSTTSSLHFRA